MFQPMRVLFPVFPVKVVDSDFGRWLIKAANIDIDAVGVGAWDIKRFDAAGCTKVVLCDAGIECISCEAIFTAE